MVLQVFNGLARNDSGLELSCLSLCAGLAKMGTSLCGMTLASRPPPPPARGCFGWAKNSGRRLLMWGAGKVQALFYMFRW